MTDSDNFAILEQNIQSKFMFSVDDIRHVTTYNNLYESCARSFITYVSERYPHVPVSIGEKPEDFTATPIFRHHHFLLLCIRRIIFSHYAQIVHPHLLSLLAILFHKSSSTRYGYRISTSHTRAMKPFRVAQLSPANKLWTSVWYPVSSIRTIATDFEWWVKG